MKTRHYTIGEILRGGMLRNTDGEPYRHKATISRVILKRFPELERRAQKFGMGYLVSKAMVDTINREHRALRRD